MKEPQAKTRFTSTTLKRDTSLLILLIGDSYQKVNLRLTNNERLFHFISCQASFHKTNPNNYEPEFF